MTTPSNAAKAASILHHTWGIEDRKAAVALYDMLDAAGDEDFIIALESAENWGIYEAFESADIALLWENIHCLAESIDACFEELT